jgi:hypothetical protein
MACVHGAQAAQEQRANKGVVTTAVRGPTRPKSSSINTSSIFADMFKGAIDDVERNHATQVWEGGMGGGGRRDVSGHWELGGTLDMSADACPAAVHYCRQ